MKLKAVRLVSVLILGLVAGPLPAWAQKPGKVYRIGYLTGTSAATAKRNYDSFRKGLGELGYVQGKNISICLPGWEGDEIEGF